MATTATEASPGPIESMVVVPEGGVRELDSNPSSPTECLTRRGSERRKRGQVAQRILGAALAADLEVEVRAARVAARAHLGNHVALLDERALFHADRAVVGVERRVVARMLHDHDAAVVAAPAALDHAPRRGGEHGRARLRGEIDALVAADSAPAVARREMAVDRPVELQIRLAARPTAQTPPKAGGWNRARG